MTKIVVCSVARSKAGAATFEGLGRVFGTRQDMLVSPVGWVIYCCAVLCLYALRVCGRHAGRGPARCSS